MRFLIKLLTLIALIIITQNAFGFETRIKIGIIDSGISFSQSLGDHLCKDGRKSAIIFDSGLDRNGHGTNVFGLIAKQIDPKTHCIISYKFWDSQHSLNVELNITNSVYQARKDGVKYINMSLGGPGSNASEMNQIGLALEEGVTIIVAAGNESTNLNITCNYFPACYKKKFLKKYNNFIVVGAKDVDVANYGKIVEVYEKGYKVGTPVLTGTSQATAIHTGKIILKNLKKRGIVTSGGKNDK